MGVYRLRRFSQPDVLKRIAPDNLRRLLLKHAAYLEGRGVLLGGAAIDCDVLARVLMDPDEGMPAPLIAALYQIDELATSEGMDAVLEAARAAPGLVESLEVETDSTPPDVVLHVWLNHPALIDQVNAEHILAAKRSYEYFPARRATSTLFRAPTDSQLAALNAALNVEFDQLRRGRYARVLAFPDGSGAAFLVRRGDSFRREGAVGTHGGSTVAYRPEMHDVVRYDQQLDELAINAESRKIKDIYRREFGQHIFGDPEFFGGDGRFTLEPLRVDGRQALVCEDIEGMESVVLTEVKYSWGGAFGEVEVRKARNLLAALESRGRGILRGPHPRLVSATFEVVFTGSKSKRKVTVRPTSVANYTRDSDAEIVKDWLLARGFLHRDAG